MEAHAPLAGPGPSPVQRPAGGRFRWARARVPGAVLSRVIAAALVATCAAGTSHAQSGVRINEVFFACSDGDTTIQFIEFVNTGPDTVLSGNLRFEYQPGADSVAFSLNPWGSSAGFPWAHGRTFVLETSRLAQVLGFYADGVAALGLSRSGGVLRLATRLTDGSEITRQDLRYGALGTLPRVPDGSSLTRVSDSLYAISNPSPTTRSGATTSGATCFSFTSTPLVIRQALLQCESGLPAGQYVELGTGYSSLLLPANAVLEWFDRNGASLGRLNNVFGGQAGTLLQATQGWRLAATPDVFENPPEGALTAPLDPLAGQIALSLATAAGDSLLSELRYGGADGAPLPPPGQCLALDEATGAYEAVDPAPVDRYGSPAGLSSSCLLEPPSGVRIHEFALTCANGRGALPFVELMPTLSTDRYDPSLTLRAFDRAGALLGVVDSMFALTAGLPWSTTTAWLLADPSYLDAFGHGPDVPLPFALDTLAGRLELDTTPPAGGPPTAIQVVTYGTSAIPAPPLGESLNRVDDSTYAAGAATPTSSGGLALQSGACDRPFVSSARVDEFSLRCPSGDASYQFVNLVSTDPRDFLDSTLVLRAYDHAGVLIGAAGGLFGVHADLRWPAGTRWFVGSPPWRTATGAGPETALPWPLDVTGGRIVLEARTLSGDPVVLQDLPYGPGTPLPAPGEGQSLARTSDGYVLRTPPTPTSSAGAAYLTSPDCQLPEFSSARIQEVGLACASGAVAGQYIQLAATLASDVFDTTIVVRALDHAGTLIGQFRPAPGQSPPTPVAGAPWVLGRAYLIGTDFWRSQIFFDGVEEFISGCDARLPLVLDRDGGRIQIEAASRATGARAVVQDFVYGGATPLPPPGGSLRRDSLGAYVVQPSPTPSDWNSYRPMVNSGCDGPRLSEVFLACRDSTPDAGFVDVGEVPGLFDQIEGRLELRALDRSGGTIVPASAAFSAYGGRSLGPLRRFLVTCPGFATMMGSPGDATIPAGFDTVAGRVELGWTTPAGTFDAVDSLDYGPGHGVSAPPPGWSLHREPSGGWTADTPTPSTLSGQTFTNTSCFAPGHWPVALQEVLPRCRCGNGDESYVELVSLDSRAVFESGLTLVALDTAGVEQSRTSDLLAGSPTGALWQAGRAWLVATRSLDSLLTDASYGPVMHADGVLSGPLAAESGRILILRGAATASPETLLSLAYGRGSPSGPLPAGEVLRRLGDGSEAAGPAAPVNSAGQTPGPDAPLWAFTAQIPQARIVEILTSCSDGSPGVAYVQVATDAYSVNDGLVLQAFDRAGQRLFRVSDPFGASSCASSAPSRWLAATGAFEQVTGSAADARLPAPLDPLAGRVEIVLPTTGGDSVISALGYGVPGEPAPRPGYALQFETTLSNGQPVYAVVYASPYRSDGLQFRTPSCFEDGPPALRIEEALAECASGDTAGQYVELGVTLPDEYFDSRARLIVTDGSGAERFRLEPLAPLLDGQRLVHQPRILIAGTAFQAATGLPPDVPWSSTLATDSGSVRLEWVRAPGEAPVVLDHVAYGGRTGLALPAPGMAIRPHDTQLPDLLYPPAPQDLSGAIASVRDCFGDTCSAHRMTMQGTLVLSHAAAFDSTVQDTYYGQNAGRGEAGYDIARNETFADAIYGIAGDARGTSASYDDYVVEGLPSGAPVDFVARVQAHLAESYSYSQYLGGYVQSTSASFGAAGALLSLPPQSGEPATLDTTVTLPLHVRAGQPFKVVVSAAAEEALIPPSPQRAGGTGRARAAPPARGSGHAALHMADVFLSFDQLPAGAVLRSCSGYLSTGVVATQITLASVSAEPGRVRLQWWSSGSPGFGADVERRGADGGWTTIGHIVSDGTGALRFDDTRVEAGAAYAYRLAWKTAAGLVERSAETAVTVPLAPRFAVHGVWPNPSRGAITLAFELAEAAPVSIEVLDVAGRRVWETHGMRPAGAQTLALTRPGELRAGVYLVRLREGRRHAETRAIVMP